MDGSTSGTVSQKDLTLSGGFGRSTNSARAGFLPIGLEHAPIGALNGIPVYVRVRPGDTPHEGPEAEQAGFRLYCTESVRFSEVHRRRLLDHGVKFVYIRMVDQARFRMQTESRLIELAADPATALAEKSAIIYDTSIELVNELLNEPELIANSPRLGQVSRAITTLVMNNPNAFSHLFAASHHDFYTATHMVNVGTWMVPLAYELGYRDPEELNRICQAGMLHDMGKVDIPEEILNKKGKLTDEEWAVIRTHPDAGVEYLSQFDNVHPLILTVTREHHERLDGTGYPRGLKGDEIHAISRICAVVDSFDAMTAFRPFKDRTLSVRKTLEILQKETPAKYDPLVMRAWLKLINSAPEAMAEPSPPSPGPKNAASVHDNRRKHPRRAFHCPARAHLLERSGSGFVEKPAMPIVAHSISRGGVGLLSQTPIQPGEFLRLYLQAPGWAGRALEGQTVRCRAYRDTWHEIGLQFAQAATEGLPGDAKEA